MLWMIDNYDSFTYNLVQYLQTLGAEVKVVRNDAMSVDEIAASAKPIYRLLGAERNLRIAHPDCAHDFPPEMREAAYRLLAENLR